MTTTVCDGHTSDATTQSKLVGVLRYYSSMSRQATGFLGTLNGYDTVEIPDVDFVKYAVWGEEVAPTTGQPHLQIYLETVARKTVGGLAREFRRTHWSHAHWEVREGTRQQAIDYCKKDGQWYEYHNENSQAHDVQGRRQGEVEWSEAYALAQEGGATAVGARFPKAVICHFANLEAIHKRAKEDEVVNPLPNVCGLWIQGKSGTGKTTLAHSLSSTRYGKVLDQLRWDGYKGQQVVLFEDVDKSHKDPLAQPLKLAGDKWPFSVQLIYAGTSTIRPKLAVVTSQYAWTEIWPDVQTREALERRYAVLDVKLLEGGTRTYSFRSHLEPGSAPSPSQSFGSMAEAVTFVRAHFGLQDPSPPAQTTGTSPSPPESPSAATTTTSDPPQTPAMPPPGQVPMTPDWLLYPTQPTVVYESSEEADEGEIHDLTQESDEELW